MDNIKIKLQEIVEQASCCKSCKNCASYKNGGCSFGCLNEKLKVTTPNYVCENFSKKYDYNEDTIDAMRDLLKDIERVEEGTKNLELLLAGKINEQEFVECID